MKDYLNSQERDEFLTFTKAIDYAHRIEQSWNKRSNLTKIELMSLRMVITWGTKCLTSIAIRQNEISRKAVKKGMKTAAIMLDYRSSLDDLMKKKCTDIEAAYEENQDYFTLVELLLHYNCRNCTKKCTDCEIYKEFESKHFPEFTGQEDNGSCKYSYIMKEENTNE